MMETCTRRSAKPIFGANPKERGGGVEGDSNPPTPRQGGRGAEDDFPFYTPNPGPKENLPLENVASKLS